MPKILRLLDGEVRTREKLIAYVDVLGFSALVEEAERDGGDVRKAGALATALGSAKDSSQFAQYGPSTCPHSRHIQKDLDFQVTQISDCVVVSAEISPSGAINLAQYCFGISMRLLGLGALCRGYVTRGNIHHEGFGIRCLGGNHSDITNRQVIELK